MNKTLKKKKTIIFYRDHLPRLCGFGSPDLGDFAITGSQDGLKLVSAFNCFSKKIRQLGIFGISSRNFECTTNQKPVLFVPFLHIFLSSMKSTESKKNIF